MHTDSMNVKRTKHAERSEATRAALVAAARPLFADRGYAHVGTEEIVRAAGVTRGALYHQFRDKLELFAAVVEQLEQELAKRTGVAAMATQQPGAPDPLAELRAGAEAWLEACTEPEIQRIVLLDGPAVLGWERWREIGMRYKIITQESLHIGVPCTGFVVRPQRIDMTGCRRRIHQSQIGIRFVV